MQNNLSMENVLIGKVSKVCQQYSQSNKKIRLRQKTKNSTVELKQSTNDWQRTCQYSYKTIGKQLTNRKNNRQTNHKQNNRTQTIDKQLKQRNNITQQITQTIHILTQTTHILAQYITKTLSQTTQLYNNQQDSNMTTIGLKQLSNSSNNKTIYRQQ